MINRPAHQRPATDYLFSITLLLLLLASVQAAAFQPVVVEYFYEDGCSKCAQAAPIVNDVIGRFDNVTYLQYEIMGVYDGTTGYERMKRYGVTTVPAVVVNNGTIITYRDYQGDGKLLENLLVAGIEGRLDAPGGEALPELSLTVVFIAGLLAGFNPCLLAVLAFLASITISSKGERHHLLIMVASFSAGIFFVYMLAGLGIMSMVNRLPGMKDSISVFLILLIGFLGVWHFYDAYHLQVHNRSSFRTPDSFIRLMQNTGGKNLIIVSFLLGGIFSLVKAPCVGAVYFAILEMLISRGNIGMGTFYLGVYNLGVILPVLIVGVLLALGLSPEKVTDFREKRRVEIRLVTGAVLILLALLMYLGKI